MRLLDPPLEVLGHAPAEEMERELAVHLAATFRLLLTPWLAGEAQINPAALDGLALTWGLDAESEITMPEVIPPEPRKKGSTTRKKRS